MDFSSFEGHRYTAETARVAEFEGGLYEIDLLYFDAGGSMSLAMSIDGLPVDESAFFGSVEEFTDPPEETPLVPIGNYHPSFFLGEDSLPGLPEGTATDGRDVIAGKGADEIIDGGAGKDAVVNIGGMMRCLFSPRDAFGVAQHGVQLLQHADATHPIGLSRAQGG